MCWLARPPRLLSLPRWYEREKGEEGFSCRCFFLLESNNKILRVLKRGRGCNSTVRDTQTPQHKKQQHDAVISPQQEE